MKQAILLSGPEISALRRGRSLEIQMPTGEPLVISVEKSSAVYKKNLRSLQKARAAQAAKIRGRGPDRKRRKKRKKAASKREGGS